MRFVYNLEADHATRILGITLRYARLKEGYSLRDMGELASISHTLIANIERGRTIANKTTLKQLFSILHISFRDDDALVAEFATKYEDILNGLFEGDYSSIEPSVSEIRSRIQMYEYSVVFVDLLLLMFLHGALTNTLSDYLKNYMDLSKRVIELLSLNQQQMFYLALGIKQYNQGLYRDSTESLQIAVTVGDDKMDPLVQLYLIKNHVKMYHFMDAQQLSMSTIPAFETRLLYNRAMEVRLQLAYSHISLWKFEQANQYIALVEEYATKYHNQALLVDCLDRRLALSMMQGDMDRLSEWLDRATRYTATVTIAMILLAHFNQDVSTAQSAYGQYILDQGEQLVPREEWYLKGFMMVFGGLPYTEEEFIKTFEQIIELGKQSLDQESLLFGYDQLIAFYRNKRMYKQALSLSEEARMVRSYGRLSGEFR